MNMTVDNNSTGVKILSMQQAVNLVGKIIERHPEPFKTQIYETAYHSVRCVGSSLCGNLDEREKEQEPRPQSS